MKIDELKSAFENDTFSKSFGIELLELKERYARVKIKISDKLLNFFGTGHGGAIYAVADVAFSLACNADETVKLAVALNTSINYIKKVNPGDILIAEARVISSVKRTSITDIIIINEKNEIIAKFVGLAYLFRE